MELQAVGDYDLRGPDFETILVGPVNARIIDADRLVRTDWANGLPNWAMYRVALCGDSHLRSFLRDRCVAFSIAYCQAGAVKRHLSIEELGCLAGWDAYYALLNHKWVIAGHDIADVAGVHPATYRKVRNAVYARLRASMDEYWVRMQVAIRQVALMERRQDAPEPTSRYSDGRGFDQDEDVSGTGNYIAMPRGSGC
jgi:hypothetical protein